EMCGNGIRCIAKYIWDTKLSNKEIIEIDTLAGIIKPKRQGDMVCVDMGMPIFEPDKIPVKIDSKPPIVDYPISIIDREFKINCLSMGNPHAVIYLDESLDEFDLSKYGPTIETHSLFPKRINVEFINVINKDKIKMRVWERGAGETLACGTGACASAVASMIKGLTNHKTEVQLLGGNLFIEWTDDKSVFMTGPAKEVYTGRINLDLL
ncbi:MAG: diaminopimelate epimerase, partial [Thermodesulfovibrionales bacterium]|nr:diaminopimelate epimerase [Thermodesulfovibrionales bacterium]